MTLYETSKELRVKEQLRTPFKALNKEKDQKRALLKEVFANNPEGLKKWSKVMREEMHEKRIKGNEKDIEQVYSEKFLMKEIKKLSTSINETIEQQKKQFEELVKLVEKADDKYWKESLINYPLRSEIEDLALSLKRKLNSVGEELKKIKDITPERSEKLRDIAKTTLEEKIKEWKSLDKTTENIKKFLNELIVFKYNVSCFCRRIRNPIERINILQKIDLLLEDIFSQ